MTSDDLYTTGVVSIISKGIFEESYINRMHSVPDPQNGVKLYNAELSEQNH